MYLTQLIRMKLMNAVEFYYFPRDKILYLEGHICQSMFFMLSGEIVVSRLTYNKIEDKIIDEAINILGANDFFGHIGLIYNTIRNATCKTQSMYFFRVYILFRLANIVIYGWDDLNNLLDR